MSALLSLFGFLAAGLISSGLLLSPTQSQRLAQVLNRWVLRVALPALVLDRIHGLPSVSLSSPELFVPVSLPWLHFALSLVIVGVIARFFRWNQSTGAALALTVGLGNTSFVGLPLLEAILGREAIGTGILIDQLGSFLILSVLGIPLAQALSHQSRSGRRGWRLWLRPLLFPPFLALMTALVVRGQAFSPGLSGVLQVLGKSLGPVALVSVGLSLRLRALGRPEVRVPLVFGLLLKLVAFPAFYCWLYPLWVSRYPNFPISVLHVTLLEGAMASMITAGVVASEHDLHPELAQLMVGLSIPLSLGSVWAWSQYIV
ncbi:MAG: hypothetical protein RJB38_1228 [Pseudomonadota bacterium]|jgi:predicted permease